MRIRIPMQAGTSLLLAVCLGTLFLTSPTWNPISGVPAARAVFWTEMLTLIGCAYLFVQGAQYLTGRVGSSGGYMLDLGASAVPLVVLIVIWTSHFVGYTVLSPWMKTVMRTATYFVILDLVILGGVGALVNRLTDELSTQR
jgi:hypothetical protein